MNIVKYLKKSLSVYNSVLNVSTKCTLSTQLTESQHLSENSDRLDKLLEFWYNNTVGFQTKVLSINAK